MSVVLITPDRYDTLRWTLRALRAQTAADRLEVVVVGPRVEVLGPAPEDLASFASYRAVAIGPIGTTARARAAGIRAASAPVVAFGEDHCLPDPDWAQALIEAHDGPWAAVGPALYNGNPGTLRSWAFCLVMHGPDVAPIAPGATANLPGMNSSFKRELLLSYGEALEAILEVESFLHWDLRDKGHPLGIEPKARAAHYHFVIWRTWFPPFYHIGRQFAAARAASWSWERRLLFAAGSPLIPAIRLQRIVRDRLRRGRGDCPLARSVPLVLLALVTSAVGELVGYLRGPGRSAEALVELDYHRFRHILPRERHALESAMPAPRRAEAEGRVPCAN
jgi:hypothetical protein